MAISVESMTAYFTANPSAIDPKFGGDAAKAAESIVNLQAAYTQTSQKLAALEKQKQTGDPNTAGEGSSRNESSTTTAGSGGLVIPEPPSTASVWTEVDASVRATGTIDDALAKKMTDAGVPETVVASFKTMITDASKLARQHQAEMAAQMLGGKETLDACLKYASTLPPDERAELNKGLSSNAWQTFLMGLNARRLKATGNEPNRSIGVTGSSSGSSNDFGIVVSSHKDLLRYQADPRYRNNPAFQNAVVEASNRYYGKKK
jgi:hypothetical protein